jgi:hypothetical protein
MHPPLRNNQALISSVNMFAAEQSWKAAASMKNHFSSQVDFMPD